MDRISNDCTISKGTNAQSIGRMNEYLQYVIHVVKCFPVWITCVSISENAVNNQKKSTHSSDQKHTGQDKENVNDSSHAGERKRQRDHDVEKTSPCKKFATSLENDVPVDVVNELIDNPELLKVYRSNWRQIRPSVKKGKIFSKYNCFLPTLENVNLANCAEGVFAMQTNAFKINAAFGFILVNSETNERRYYYSSGNTKIFESPFLVKDRASFETFYKALEEIDALEYARLQRPNSKWMVEAVCNLTFFMYKIRGPSNRCLF